MFPDDESRAAYADGYKARQNKKPETCHEYMARKLKSWWLAGYRDYEIEHKL